MKFIVEADAVDQRLIAGVLVGRLDWVVTALSEGAASNIICNNGFGVTDGKHMSLLDAAVFLLEKEREKTNFRVRRDKIVHTLIEASAITMQHIREQSFRARAPLAMPLGLTG